MTKELVLMLPEHPEQALFYRFTMLSCQISDPFVSVAADEIGNAFENLIGF